MKYFKILDAEEFIGVINSDNFKSYYIRNNFLGPATEQNGQVVELKGKLYRDTWMETAINVPFPHKQVSIIEIPEEEYRIYYEAARIQDEIERQKYIEEYEKQHKQEQNPEEPEQDETPISSSIEYLRQTKIKEMSFICNKTIEKGFDITLGEKIHHFSLTVQDQLNLISLSAMASSGAQQIPYHADGELCKFYTPEEINTIVNQATYFKTYHTTYYNGLKAYINSLENIQDIDAITYGMPLPEEYQTDVWKELNQ